MVGRREFIFLFGATAAWPVAICAKEAMPIVGILHSASPSAFMHHMDAVRQGLKASGFIENQNIAIEQRWAENDYDRLPRLAAELVRHPVAVLVTLGGDASALAAKAASSTIPIVFNIGGDPVQLGLVESFNRPGGNATGVSTLSPALEGKRLGLLHDLVGGAKTIGVLLNPNFPSAQYQLRDVQDAARALGVKIDVMRASTDREIEAAFDAVTERRLPALLQLSDPFFFDRRTKVVTLAARSAMPTMYQFREYAVAGGLISYGARLSDSYRNVGIYAGRILNGAKPSDLPVIQPTRIELVINLKTAKVLGLKVPDSILLQADEVIE